MTRFQSFLRDILHHAIIARQALALVLLVWGVVSENTCFGESPPSSEDGPKVDFVRDIQPVLARRCYACHGPDEHDRQAGLRLDTEVGLATKTDQGTVVTPGSPESSLLYQRITSLDPETRMPPKSPLSPAEIEALQTWIARGAKWSSHWAFSPIRNPLVPVTDSGSSPSSPIDHFVAATANGHGMQMSTRADGHTLARRLALDLTGLPPTEEQLALVGVPADPAAYERLVEELLASPAFGERFARVWLDLARYADTRGYEKDRSRTIWRFRDWVIDAYNRDLTYDQFTREQLAGDLLENSNLEQKVATAFHRNTMVNEEGGTDDEEFRVAAVKDRVDTTIQVWMGLTMGCAKCHSHKYDPISQREYYEMFAFFNQTADSDRGDEYPTLHSPNVIEAQDLARIRGRRSILQNHIRAIAPVFQTEAKAWWDKASQEIEWRIPKATRLRAASGSNLKQLDDGSILVSPGVFAKEEYELDLPLGDDPIGAIRLEALPDSSHPKGGTGRAKDDGNFVLSRIEAELVSPSGGTTPVEFGSAIADFSQDNYPVEHAIHSTDLATQGWAVAPRIGERHVARFSLSLPISVPSGTSLRVRLKHFYVHPNGIEGFSLGRFRISTSKMPASPLESSVPTELATILSSRPSQISLQSQSRLLRHYVENVAEATAPIRAELAKLAEEESKIRPPFTPVLVELSGDKQRKTHVHLRGSFLDRGDEVSPSTPSALHAFDPKGPRDRLGVADWLVSERNPLTARVAVNRIWAQLFGAGLVLTQEDFGTQGQPPTHPELLDSLASEYIRSGWSTKAIVRKIVLSNVYQQTSAASPESFQRDRYNRWLCRGPRFRLEAETVRDQTLAVAGLLSRKMHGPSVMPPQPEGIWKSTYNTDKWVTSSGEDRFRRGLYTFVKRTSPYPSMQTFDAPSREVCTVRRIPTNTPLQALVTLNDPAFLEAAQALARQVLSEGVSDRERLAKAVRHSLSRPPQERELDVLEKLLEQRRREFLTQPESAMKFSTEPLGPLPNGASPVEAAAYTAVCNVLLNTDEFMMRN